MNNKEKIQTIKEWYGFRDSMCDKYHDDCRKCPCYESTDGYPGDNGKYVYIHNCKYNFEAEYAEDIVELIEKYKK